MYSINDDDMRRYKGIVVLEWLRSSGPISISLDGLDHMLSEILLSLSADGNVEVQNKEYNITDKGNELLSNVTTRLQQYIDEYAHFSAVDLTTGEFCWSHYFDQEYSPDIDKDGSAWRTFISLPRWEDLRVAVALANGANPIDIVFLSFLDEGRFNIGSEEWQCKLFTGEIFDEILAICNSAIRVDQLGYKNGDEEISGQVVLVDIITKGLELRHQLAIQKNKLDKAFRESSVQNEGDVQMSGSQESVVVEEVVEEVVEIVEYPRVWQPLWYIY